MLYLLALIAHAQECPVPEDCDDADGDGFSEAEGDCDDDDALVGPDRTEACDNDVDDDCDGLFNEGCSQAAQQGTLAGGGACGSEEAPVAGLLLLPLAWRRRR